MSKNNYRLGFVWPGGGAEHDFYRFLEEIGDSIRLYISCTRVGGDGENDHDISALEQTARLDWLVEACQRLIPLNIDCVYCRAQAEVLCLDAIMLKFRRPSCQLLQECPQGVRHWHLSQP